MDKPMENTYINIQSWMVGELGLKNNELLIYAIIYGFCQDGRSRFVGGRSYFAMWTGSTVRGVQKNLNSLMEKGLIAKEEKVQNGVKACEYYPINLPWERADEEGQIPAEEGGEQSSPLGNKVHWGREQSSPGVGNKVHQGREQSSPGVGNKVHQGREQSSPNNINNNIKDNIVSSSSSDEPGEPLPSPRQNMSRMVALVVERWNELQGIGIKPVSKISGNSARYEMLRVRLREYGLEGVLSAIGNISRSRFLRGHNRNGWTITFDWFVRPNNFPKVLEGNYDDPVGDALKGGSGDGDSGRESGGYSGGCGEGSGRGGGSKGYDPRDFLGSLLDS